MNFAFYYDLFVEIISAIELKSKAIKAPIASREKYWMGLITSLPFNLIKLVVAINNNAENATIFFFILSISKKIFNLILACI